MPSPSFQTLATAAPSVLSFRVGNIFIFEVASLVFTSGLWFFFIIISTVHVRTEHGTIFLWEIQMLLHMRETTPLISRIVGKQKVGIESEIPCFGKLFFGGGRGIAGHLRCFLVVQQAQQINKQ